MLFSFLLLSFLQAPKSAAPQLPLKPSPIVSELSTHPEWPRAQDSDVSSPRTIVAAFFSAISAPKGGKLDRERLQSLFTPGGRIEIPSPGTQKEAADVAFMSPDEYADLSDQSTARSGFFDHLLAAHTQQFGVITHVFAAYESRTELTDTKPFVRGVKSFELLKSGNRWYITQVSWDRERKGVQIPDGLLHDSNE